MWQRSLFRTHISKWGFSICFLFQLLLVNTVAGDVVLEIGQATGNPGDTVEVPVYLVLDDNHIGPSAMILEFLYDPEKLMPDETYYEFIARTSTGQIFRDSSGNTSVTRSMLRLDANVTEKDKVAELVIFPEIGIVRVVIMGINDNIIETGIMFNMAFRIDSSVNAGENLMIMWEIHRTSAAEPSGGGLGLSFEDGYIATGCEGPKAPVDLQASKGSRNGVELKWQPVGGSGITYRVYRSLDANPETSLALGVSWIDGTAFMDYSADAAIVLQRAGCRQPAQLEQVEYYYWVRARSAEGCPGMFSDVATGYRGQAKSEGTDLEVRQAAGFALTGDFIIISLILILLSGAYTCLKPGIASRKTSGGTFSSIAGYIK